VLLFTIGFFKNDPLRELANSALQSKGK
jgi:hypothetical protein